MALWRLAAISLPTGLALLLYWWLAAPGLTWAHAGADGGDLLAAAVVNGVPHPAGYPIYTLLLRGWLWLGHLLNPAVEPAYWGNRLSGLCVAGAVGCTVAAAAALLRADERRWQWAMLAGLAFAVTPLAWSQALITEVYGLHALLVAALGWAALRHTNPLRHETRAPDLLLGVLMGLGAAHHLTSLLLWPALFIWRLYEVPRRAWLTLIGGTVALALGIAAISYGSIVWRVASAAAPPPVAWGYPHDWRGLWWLISGAAYRSYLFDMTPLQYLGRLATLAQILVEQYTPLGLAWIIGGLAVWDRGRARLRHGALWWVLPVSLYATGYNTVDSYIYLLPVTWLMALVLAQGMASSSAWLSGHLRAPTPALAPALITVVAIAGLVSLGLWRLPQFDLRQDQAARAFLAEAATTLEPGSLVISSGDATTFALWYGQWGSAVDGHGTLAQAVPDLVFVNYALYQFGWYRNLMQDEYKEVPQMGAAFGDLIAANRGMRPIYLAEPLPEVPAAELTQTGAFWRLNTPSTP